ncbi:MAG: glycosyltransferase family 2 protein [Lachnospiraceae bacterium]
MLVSLCVIAYNEQGWVEDLLSDILNQSYDRKQIEVLLIDGGSTDNTKKIFNDFARDNRDKFYDIRVLDNPKRTQPCGWNVAISNYSGEAMIRVDAHGRIPADFVGNNVAVLESGEDICGGHRPTINKDGGKWQETLLLAENSMFGSSIAPYRRSLERTYVNSLFHGAYRRKVLEKVGFFNEKLQRTEDNEMHYRMRQAGFKFCYDASITSNQYIRSSLKKMLKQKFGNGYWIGVTAKICPKCLSLYHFVPFAFVVAIILTTLGSLILRAGWMYFLTGLMWSVYGVLAVVMAVMGVIGAPKKARSFYNLTLPVLFLLLHVSYGVGTLLGLCKNTKKL